VPGTSNFFSWNANANNQESDAAYNSDTQRLNGAVSGVFASQLANKLFYQLAIFVAAMAQALAAKGYSPNDGSANPSTALANLETVLGNILTNADLGTITTSFGNKTGHVKLGSLFGGLTIQWGLTSSIAPNTLTAITFATAFATNVPVVLLTPSANNAVTSQAAVTLDTQSGFSLIFQGSSNSNFFWLAIGN
jgi:hypothetical protein